MQSIFDSLGAAAGWAETHPLLFTMVIWPFVLGLFTLLLKPRTPEQYQEIARLSPRLADTLRFLAALGIDPIKLSTVFGEILRGGKAQPPPAGPSILPIVFFACALSLTQTSCAWWEKHHDQVIDILADKTKCALSKMNLPEDAIIQKCLLNPEDIPRIFPLLGVARAEMALEVSAARGEERAKVGAKAACSGDAGTP